MNHAEEPIEDGSGWDSRPLQLTDEEKSADTRHSKLEEEILARQRVMLVSHQTMTQQIAELSIGQQGINKRIEGLESGFDELRSGFGDLKTELETNSSMTTEIRDETAGIREAVKTIAGGMHFFAWIGEKRLGLLGGAAALIACWEWLQSWFGKN